VRQGGGRNSIERFRSVKGGGGGGGGDVHLQPRADAIESLCHEVPRFADV